MGLTNIFSNQRIKVIGALAVMLAGLLWAIDLIVLRPTLWHLDVTLVVFLEHLIAFSFMLIPLIIEWKELKKLKPIDWAAFLLIAVLSGAVGTMAITKALFYVNFVNLSVVTLLQKLQPIFAIFFAYIILKEKPLKNYYFWAILALIGSYFVTFGFNKPVFDGKVFAASLFAIIAAAAWGSSTVFSKFAVTKVNFRVGTYIRFGLTTIFMFFVVLIFGNFSKLKFVEISNLLTLILIVFTTGGVAIFIYYYGLKKIPASVATICELTLPLSAVILEYLIRGKLLNLGQWFGAALLLTSILMISHSKKDVVKIIKKNWFRNLLKI